MPQGTEIYSREFDAIFYQLPPTVRERIEAKIGELGRRLEDFPHQRLQVKYSDVRIAFVPGLSAPAPGEVATATSVCPVLFGLEKGIG